MKITSINDHIDCTNFLTESICADLSDQAAMTLVDNGNALEAIDDRIKGLLDDLIGELGEDGEDIPTFDVRLNEEFMQDPNAPTVQAPFSTPSAMVPEVCVGVNYDDLADFVGVVSQSLSYEKYLMQRLSTLCGDTATELMGIDDGLDVTLAEAEKFNAECLDEFYAAFGEG